MCFSTVCELGALIKFKYQIASLQAFAHPLVPCEWNVVPPPPLSPCPHVPTLQTTAQMSPPPQNVF